MIQTPSTINGDRQHNQIMMSCALCEARRNLISSLHISLCSSPTVPSLSITSIFSSSAEFSSINFINSISGSKLDISSIVTVRSDFKQHLDDFCLSKYSAIASVSKSPAYAYGGIIQVLKRERKYYKS